MRGFESFLGNVLPVFNITEQTVLVQAIYVKQVCWEYLYIYFSAFSETDKKLTYQLLVLKIGMRGSCSIGIIIIMWMIIRIMTPSSVRGIQFFFYHGLSNLLRPKKERLIQTLKYVCSFSEWWWFNLLLFKPKCCSNLPKLFFGYGDRGSNPGQDRLIFFFIDM